jgi:serine/threonine protein kinase
MLRKDNQPKIAEHETSLIEYKKSSLSFHSKNIQPTYKKLLSPIEQTLPKDLHAFVIDATNLIVDFKIASPTRIGSGYSGIVRSGLLTTAKGNKTFAVKTPNHFFQNREEVVEAITKANKRISAEAFILHKLQSPETIKFLGIFGDSETNTIFSILMPLYPTNLKDFLKKSDSISLIQKATWAKDLSRGLQNIHARHYIYCDLKSPNILLTKNKKAKICDFGSVQSADEQKPRIGTYNWMAPEIIPEETFNTKQSDIYSLGMVLWELITQKIPFAGIDKVELEKKKTKNEHEVIPIDCPLLFKELISACWKNKPEERPTAQMIADTLDAALQKPDELEKVSIYSLGFFKKKNTYSDEIKKIPTNLSIPPELYDSFINRSNVLVNLSSADTLGEGTFATVNKGFLCLEKNGQKVKEPVAIKTMHISKNNSLLLKEAMFMKSLQSVYTAKFMGFFYDPDFVPGRLGIVMTPYKKTLHHFLNESKENISFEQKIKLALDISRGIELIHEAKCIHGDLKSPNIFLDEDNMPKIGDFGQTFHISDTNKSVGTIRWSAPEWFQNADKSYPFASEIYTLGLVLWEIMERKLPFNKTHNVLALIREKNKGRHESLSENCPLLFKTIILQCWDNDPQKRPTAKMIADQFELEFKKIQSTKLLDASQESKQQIRNQHDKNPDLLLQKPNLSALGLFNQLNIIPDTIPVIPKKKCPSCLIL